MKCCHSQSPHAGSGKRVGVSGAGTLLSGAALLLIPKCPLCVAAYVMLVTGVLLSPSQAYYLRWSAMGICITMLVASVFMLTRFAASAQRPAR